MELDEQLPGDLDSVIQNTSQEFAAFFKISSSTHGESIYENIEGVLARLDELYGMLDMIRNDNNTATDDLLPIVRDDLARLQPVFDQIDRLEEFVEMVKQNVAEVEKELKVAEKDFGAFSTIKKVVAGLPLFNFRKKDSVRRAPPPKPAFVAPTIFSTSEWLPKPEASLNEEKDKTNSDESPQISDKVDNKFTGESSNTSRDDSEKS